MPLLTLDFDNNVGATLLVGVAAPISVTKVPPDQQSVEPVRLLVDTGADVTSIGPHIASKLGLGVLGQTPVTSVTNTAWVNEYLCDLIWTVPNPPVPLRDIRVMEHPMAGGKVDGLLGRDLLRYGMLVMNGPTGTFTLAF